MKNDSETKSELEDTISVMRNEMKGLAIKLDQVYRERREDRERFDEILLRFDALTQKLDEKNSKSKLNDEQEINEIYFELEKDFN